MAVREIRTHPPSTIVWDSIDSVDPIECAKTYVVTGANGLNDALSDPDLPQLWEEIDGLVCYEISAVPVREGWHVRARFRAPDEWREHWPFWAGIKAQEGDDAPKLAYADYLMENGMWERGQMVRMAVKLAEYRRVGPPLSRRKAWERTVEAYANKFRKLVDGNPELKKVRSGEPDWILMSGAYPPNATTSYRFHAHVPETVQGGDLLVFDAGVWRKPRGNERGQARALVGNDGQSAIPVQLEMDHIGQIYFPLDPPLDNTTFRDTIRRLQRDMTQSLIIPQRLLITTEPETTVKDE